jgi:tetratricopeptide (TPR) repeat protein
LLFASPIVWAQDAGQLNDQAVALYEQGDYARALVLLRDALQQQPENQTFRHNASRCLIGLGDALYQSGSYREAARDYHEAAGLVPDDPAPVLREAMALQQEGLDRDVVSVLNKALHRWPDLGPGHETLANSLYRLGENARAIEHWERALTGAEGDVRQRIERALERARKDEGVEGELYNDLQAPHFSIKYDGAADAELGRLVGRVLEDAYNTVGRILGRYPEGETAVVIYPGKTFQTTTGAHGWVAGLYDGKIRVPAAGLSQARAAEVQRVLRHEYAHALVRAVGGPRVPVWLQEGFAQVVEGRTMTDAVRYVMPSNVPSLEELGTAFTKQQSVERARVLYAAALGLTRHLFSHGGGPLLADLLDRLGRNEDLDESLRRVYGRDLSELYTDWVATLH